MASQLALSLVLCADLMVAPSANIVNDFRLAGEVGPLKAVINLEDIANASTGHPWARIYWVADEEPPTGFVTYTKFDCTTRTFVYEHVWTLNRQLDVPAEGNLPETQRPDRSSTADQVVDFICGDHTARTQRLYLGSEWKSAIRAAAPHFR